MPAALTDLLRRTSSEGLIAYVEAASFVGIGQQASVLWEHGLARSLIRIRSGA